MISVDEALEKVLSYVNLLETEEKPVLDCLGQVLAEDVASSADVPPLDNSAMDGYAVRAADINGASPKTPCLLRVIATLPAGNVSRRRVEPGTAIRIMTGAPVPDGADTVVRFEDTDETLRKQVTGEVGILVKVAAGSNIRQAGEDISRGAKVFNKGTVIRPQEIGVLASLGRGKIKVIRRPVVAILATGDELEEIGRELRPGKIYNSNTYALAAQVARYGGQPKVLGIARDNQRSLNAKLSKGLDSDLLITSGGVSMGDYDLVKEILAQQGEITFWQVRMKPGKPLAFGRIGKVPLLGLPGNPVSSMVSFEIFARPAMLKMMGKPPADKPVIWAVTDSPIENRDGRRVYVRAKVEKNDGGYLARITGAQGSGILTSMARANSLIIIPEDRDKIAAGEKVQAIMLDWDEEF
ncbi:MAG: gephyrin-like molybdotransferase Glp [Dehalococcoidales bacterium]|jgi:molybdopterin molybdotransferase